MNQQTAITNIEKMNRSPSEHEKTHLNTDESRPKRKTNEIGTKLRFKLGTEKKKKKKSTYERMNCLEN